VAKARASLLVALVFCMALACGPRRSSTVNCANGYQPSGMDCVCIQPKVEEKSATGSTMCVEPSPAASAR
jgi:hypothetical protein